MKRRKQMWGITLALVLAVSAPGQSLAAVAAAGDMQEPAKLQYATLDAGPWIYQDGGMGNTDSGQGISLYSIDEGSARETQAYQQAVAAVQDAMRRMEDTVDISQYKISPEKILELWTDALNFCPEAFYVDGRIRYSHMYNILQSITFTYVEDDKEAIRKKQEEFNAAIEKVEKEVGIPKTAEDYEYIRGFHDYLAQHIAYEEVGYKNGHSAYDALVGGKAVCQGYSLAYYLLLERAGVRAGYVDSESMNHMWNMVWPDGDKSAYHVDVTWDDPVKDKVGYVRHFYMMNSDEKVKQSPQGTGGHYDWTAEETCTSTKYDNAFWQTEADSAIFSYEGKEYYLSYQNQKLNLIQRDGAATKTLISKPAVWETNAGGFWVGSYAGLSYYKDALYFNDSTKIYKVSLKNNPSWTSEDVYTYPGADGKLYGSLVCEGKIRLGVASSPNDEQEVKVVDLPGVEVPEDVIKGLTVTADMTTLPWTDKKTVTLQATAEILDGWTKPVTYKCEALTNLSPGQMANEVPVQQDGNESSVFKVDPCRYGKPGDVKYKVTASTGTETMSYEITIKVTKGKVTISSNTAAPYPNTKYEDGNPLSTPKAEQFIITPKADLSFAWYGKKGQENTRLETAPSNVGTYYLKAYVEETDTLNYSEFWTEVKIMEAEVDPDPDPDPDRDAPKGTIRLGAKSWDKLTDKSTFTRYRFKENRLTIEASDAGSGMESVRYYVYNGDTPYTTVEELEGQTIIWKTYETPISVEEGRKTVVYVKLTDQAENVTYLSTEGLFFDRTAPKLNGLKVEASEKNEARISFTANEVSDYYYVVMSGDASAQAPAAEDIIRTADPDAAETGNILSQAVAAGSGSIAKENVSEKTIFTVKGLEPGKTYQVWMTAADEEVLDISDSQQGTAARNISPVISCDLTTGEEDPAEEEISFSDVNAADWFYEGVVYNAKRKIMVGKTETNFAPYENLARAQFALILYRLNDMPNVEYTNQFDDVAPDIWYTDAILWAHSVRVVNGYSNTRLFGPGDNINREQMAVMMYRYANNFNFDTSERGDFSEFQDGDRVNGFATEAMRWAIGAKIITGKTNEEGKWLDPQGNATRAECALIIQRFMEKYEL